VRRYLLDTNIISYYLKGIDSLKEKISDNIEVLSISIISYYEIVSGLQSINAKKRITDLCLITKNSLPPSAERGK